MKEAIMTPTLTKSTYRRTSHQVALAGFSEAGVENVRSNRASAAKPIGRLIQKLRQKEYPMLISCTIPRLIPVRTTIAKLTGM